MEVKVIKPQPSASPDPVTSKQESRGLRIIQYLSKTVSGSSFREPNNTHNASDSEESDEEMHTHTKQRSSPSDNSRPSLFQKISHGLVKSESSYTDEEKVHSQNEHTNTYWGVSKSVLDVSKGVAADLKGSFGRIAQMKGMLIEKLSSMPTIPADSLEHARHSIESIISDATQSAYGKTKDAMSRIRLKLVEIIPSLSPHETKKIVDDVEREVNDMAKTDNADDGQQAKDKSMNGDGTLGVPTSPASSAIASQPTSGFAANMDRWRAWALLRSRL
ncbi:hypothetical protein L7F22_022567 [Adiantum nelumboides]|nr:hypothetical protein [Adiantum nelumboides]